MQRPELSLTDEDIIQQIANAWNFVVANINYIDFGSTFAFILTNKVGEKVFLKIYEKHGYVLVNNYKHNDDFLRVNSDILSRLHSRQHMHEIPVVIKTKNEEYFYEYNDFVFLLSHYVEGKHPLYEPNELRAAELASILNNLHSAPISEYPEVTDDNFNIEYALGLELWLDFSGIEHENIKPMLERISGSREFLKQSIVVLKQLQSRFLNSAMELVLTHGDAHHFNVLQTNSNMFLIDWDDLRIGPRERDLWHYEFAPLMADYLRLNPNFSLNHDLCMFYQLNRFLEDLRVYLEEFNSTEEQVKQNIKDFCNHWGWVECYKRIQNLN